MSITGIVSVQKKAFQNGINRSYRKRKANLEKLRKLISENEKQLCEAIHQDFGKPYIESYTTEIYLLLEEIDFHLKNLSQWMANQNVSGLIVTFPSKYVVHKQPLGTVLIIGTWNYPVQLTLLPVVGALSAGNTVVLKPSETAPATSAAIRALIEHSFEPNLFTVIEGGVPETTELLSQPFDKIFFTGSSRVGKIVMKAAAEQLIPVTLELGGKSPAIVHKDANVEVSARRIWWGKTVNAGQTCVAPDFVVVHEFLKNEFIEQSKKVLSKFFADGYQPGKNYTKIINDDHFERLKNLLDRSEVLAGGSTNKKTRFIEPTLLDANWENEIMQDEIFGPLLPLLTYSDENNLVQKLRDMPSPLALYLFSDNSAFEKKIIDNVPFGGGCINDTITHFGNPNLPIGGVGSSGMGNYHGKYSFNTFSRDQAVLKKNFWPDPDIRYPPYDDSKLSWFKRLFS